MWGTPNSSRRMSIFSAAQRVNDTSNKTRDFMGASGKHSITPGADSREDVGSTQLEFRHWGICRDTFGQETAWRGEPVGDAGSLGRGRGGWGLPRGCGSQVKNAARGRDSMGCVVSAARKGRDDEVLSLIHICRCR